MGLSVEVRKNTYYDSVTLMLISKEIKKIEGVQEALVGMGTELNKELAMNLNITNDDIKEIGPNDFFISVSLEDDSVKGKVVEIVDTLLNQKKSES